MTTSDYRKMLTQLVNKPVKYKKYLKHNAQKPRKFGSITKKCKRCGRTDSHISKYGLDVCRQCFRDIATKIGFKKFS